MAVVLMGQMLSMGQGLVDFINTAGSQIYTNAGPASRGPTEPVEGSYFYGLFVAAPGTSDPGSFSFTGIYATNLAASGRLVSGTPPNSIPGWAPATDKAFLVRGWSANLGHDWTVIQDQLNAQKWSAAGFYGESIISEGTAGGTDGTNTFPALGIFGGAQGLLGFDLYVVNNSPRLTITSSGSAIVLTWPTSDLGFTLQSSTALNPAEWTTVLPNPLTVNGQNVVTNLVSRQQMFYRLIH